MDTFSFSALGTAWNITVDGRAFDQETKQVISEFLRDFESRFSRFLPESEVNAFRAASSGEYAITPEFATLLQRASELRSFTRGAFDPSIGASLERAGYGRMEPLSAVPDPHAPLIWSISGNTLSLSGPIAFDLGGIGKGYAIDRVSRILLERGFRSHLVEGGGDMRGTSKESGEGWKIAVEWPGRPDTAISVLFLSDAGFAASDVFRRRFGGVHHILDATTGNPVARVIGCAAVAPTAWDADSMTSALFLSSSRDIPSIANAYAAQYLILDEEERVNVSSDWRGELFV